MGYNTMNKDTTPDIYNLLISSRNFLNIMPSSVKDEREEWPDEGPKKKKRKTSQKKKGK
jgi:hypothetical protein